MLKLYYLYLKSIQKTQQFSISYNNIKFYKNFRNQYLYNKMYIVNYIEKYIYFIKIINGIFLLYISYEYVQYNTINNFIAINF